MRLPGGDKGVEGESLHPFEMKFQGSEVGRHSSVREIQVQTTAVVSDWPVERLSRCAAVDLPSASEERAALPVHFVDIYIWEELWE